MKIQLHFHAHVKNIYSFNLIFKRKKSAKMLAYLGWLLVLPSTRPSQCELLQHRLRRRFRRTTGVGVGAPIVGAGVGWRGRGGSAIGRSRG